MTTVDTTPLLLYSISADPPIRLGNPTRIRIGVRAAAGTPIYCDSIVVKVEVGDDARSLFIANPRSSVTNPKWAVDDQMAQHDERPDDPVVEGSPASVPYHCVSEADYKIDYNLELILSGTVTATPGDATVTIIEYSGTSNDPNDFTEKTMSQTVSKAEREFYLRDLIATREKGGFLPVTDFPSGAEFYLQWQSNGTSYQVYEKGSADTVYSGPDTSCVVPKGRITRDTTIVIVASRVDQAAADDEAPGVGKQILYDSITVTVSNPELTPSTLTVTGNSTLTGNVGIGTTAPSNAGVDRLVDVVGSTSAGLTVRGSSVTGRVAAQGARAEMTLGTTSEHPLAFVTAGEARLTVSQKGFVGIGTSQPPQKLTVQADDYHLALLRPENSPPAKSKIFLELRQDDTKAQTTPDFAMGIHFTHGERFSKRIEADRGGFHFRELREDGVHAAVHVGPLYVNGDVDARNRVVHAGDLNVGGKLCIWNGNAWKPILRRYDRPGDTWEYAILWEGSPSDARLKTAVRPITGALRSVLSLTGMRYRWGEAGLEHLTRDVGDSVSAGPGATEDEEQQVRDAEVARARAALDRDDIGLLAQDVERVAPELVREGEGGYKYLRYSQLTALFVEAFKEQQQIIERLTGRVEALTAGTGY